MTPTTSIKSPFEKGFASKMIIPSKKLASESLIASAKAAEAAGRGQRRRRGQARTAAVAG